jgi:hypothetical protein
LEQSSKEKELIAAREYILWWLQLQSTKFLTFLVPTVKFAGL